MKLDLTSDLACVPALWGLTYKAELTESLIIQSYKNYDSLVM